MIGNAGVRRRLAWRGSVVPLALLLVVLGGCGGLGRIHVFTVSMVNDTTSEVVLRGCAHFCSSALLTYDLQPGQGVDVHRVANDHKEFSITTPSGRRIGCLDLYFKTPQPGARMYVSAAGPCPARSGPPWRTIALALLVALPALALLVLRMRS